MDLTGRFAERVLLPEVPLDECALLVGAHGDPRCDVDAWLSRMDDLALGVTTPTLDGVCDHLFSTMGLRGATSDYYDPRNSYLHEVMERRRGIPISLSVLLMETGRRVGLTLEGISTPAHFMVRDGHERFVDAFAAGKTHDREGLDRLFATIAPGVDLDPFLVPVGQLDILRRMLGNLIHVHQRRGDRDGLRWATELRTLLPGAAVDDRRAHAGALAANGAFAEAAAVFEGLVEEGVAADPDAALEKARRLRARLN